MPIRLLIVDDHSVVRQGLRMLLGLDDEIEVVGECADGAQALERARQLSPDVVIMNLVMPVLDGVAATRMIRQELSETEVIALTSVVEDATVVGAIRAGAIGYLLKDTETDELRQAVKAAAAGRVQLSPAAAARLVEDVRGSVSLETLTGRETQVLTLLAFLSRSSGDLLMLGLYPPTDGTIRIQCLPQSKLYAVPASTAAEKNLLVL